MFEAIMMTFKLAWHNWHCSWHAFICYFNINGLIKLLQKNITVQFFAL